jgi:hypothetical protein
MVYTVVFNPTDADYKIMRRLGYALERGKYPVVSKSGFGSPEDAQRYIDQQEQPGAGKSRESYRIIPGSFPDPDRNWD